MCSQLANRMRTDLVLDALRMALGQRDRGANVELVHHSERDEIPAFRVGTGKVADAGLPVELATDVSCSLRARGLQRQPTSPDRIGCQRKNETYADRTVDGHVEPWPFTRRIKPVVARHRVVEGDSQFRPTHYTCRATAD